MAQFKIRQDCDYRFPISDDCRTFLADCLDIFVQYEKIERKWQFSVFLVYYLAQKKTFFDEDFRD